MKPSASRGPSRPWGIGRVLAIACLAGVIVVGVASARSTRATASPANTSAPSISGSATTGSTLTASPGSWSGTTPISFQYHWQICGQTGNACHDISGATSQTYQIKPDDKGNTIRVRVVASNADGLSSALSAATGGIAQGGGGPANGKLPWINGTMTAGNTLTAETGDWSGNSPITFTYQWQSCDANGNNCRNISGATGQTYKLLSSDAGATLRVQVTAKNAVGSASATSDHSAKIAPAAPATGCPAMAAGAQSVPVTSINSPARLQVASFFSNPRVLTASFGSFALQVHVSDTCGQAVQGAQVYATAVPFNQLTAGKNMTDGAGNATLQLNRRAGFPAASKQRRLVLFVRATKPGDNVLAGVSTRRLISLRVNLSNAGT